MEYKHLLLREEEGIAFLTINRPQALNALNRQVLTELASLLAEVEKKAEIKVVIITGAGEKAFVAGADIAEMKDFNPRQAEEFAALGQQVLQQLEDMKKIVIAAVNGYALGGGNELALACDLRLASSRAKFGQPELGLGIIPGFGGTQRLARIIGATRAKELLFTGEIIDAQKAAAIGLVNAVVAPDELLEKAREMALKIAAQAPLALERCKMAVNMGLLGGMEEGINLEKSLFALCFSTEDQKRGMEAFVQKKQVKFVGK